MLSHSDIIAQFCDAMRAVVPGLHPSDIVADGEIHRFTVEGDRRNSGNGWYSLHLDGHPAGAFGSWKSCEEGKWCANGEAMSMADKVAFREKMERAREKRESDDQVRREKAAEIATTAWEAARHKDVQHAYLEAKGIQSCGARIGDFPLIDRETGAITRTIKGALLLQVRDLDKNIHSIQAIVEQRAEDGSTRFQKLFLSSGSKRGHFHAIGQPKRNADGQYIFIVVEGFSTGASVHQATGHATVCAYDAGNLIHVAKAIRSKFADAVIVLAGDDDAFTDNGNTGRAKATAAAAAVRGLVAFPVFESDDLAARPTDWNDAHALHGLEFVERGINAALYPADDAHAVEHGDAGDVLAQQSTKVKPKIAHDHADAAAREVEEDGGFSILGYDRNEYFIFVHGKKQILNCTRGSFSISGLLEISELNFWERHFPSKQGINANAAANFVIQTAHRRGIYDRSRVRAGGAWMDAGRSVFHHGDHLSVDGVETDVTQISSRYVYEMTLPLPPPSDTVLSDADGRRLFSIAKSLRWQRDSSAAMLAGWTYLAPICGALRWRPHIWLTGPAGNGKSTILQRYVYPLLGKHGCQYAQGNSTESGVRQALGSTSVPVLLDEAEKNGERETARVESMLSLIRQSSSESDAQTLKGTISGAGMAFYVRSMFCLASILVGMERKADTDRLSVLSLKPIRLGDQSAAAHWQGVKEQLHWIECDPHLRGRMLRRAIDNMSTILANIEIFTKAGAVKFGSQRAGDQYGTLAAGAWSMQNSGLVTEAQARAWLDSFDWTEHEELAAESDDSENALEELMGAFITVMGTRHTVHNLISFALGEEVEGRSLDSRQARTELNQHGIGLDGGRLLLSNTTPALKKLLAGTPYATDPKTAFERLPGAEKWRGGQLRFNGIKARAVSLPLSAISFGGVKNIASESELL